MATTLQGVELVRAVIERIREKGFGVFRGESNREPRPVAMEVLDGLRLDGEMPLTPCMKEWLAFDDSLFRWVTRDGELTAVKLSALGAEQDMDEPLMAHLEREFFPADCLRMPFTEPDRLVFVTRGEPDAIGELGVISIETDNMQVLVEHPGIDVYLGLRAGLVSRGNPFDPAKGSEEDFEERFGERIEHHKKCALRGSDVLDLEQLSEVAYEASIKNENLPPNVVKGNHGMYLFTGQGDVPNGFELLEEMPPNPFTKERLRALRRVT